MRRAIQREGHRIFGQSQNSQDIPHGLHQTALSLHDLSDLNPAKRSKIHPDAPKAYPEALLKAQSATSRRTGFDPHLFYTVQRRDCRC